MSVPTTVRPRRWPWLLVAGLAVLALALAAALLRPWQGPAAPAAAEPVTAAVERLTLTSDLRLNAQLGYGEAVPLQAAPGTLTALPAAGAVIVTGQQVYEADGRPVVLFRGARPFWRELALPDPAPTPTAAPTAAPITTRSAAPDTDDDAAEAPSGEDVRQLQQNLSELGFYRGAVDGGFGSLTQQAVRAWQRSLGVPQTGVFSPADAVVADAPSIRIAQVTARLGDTETSPATSTETTLRATARLTEAQARELAVGAAVTVVLPDSTELDGVIATVDPGGQVNAAGETSSPSAVIDIADQAAASAAGAVAVRIVIRQDAAQQPTLVVPVIALVATVDGGYAVDVYAEGRIVRTPVQIGQVGDARVQLLASGTEVDGGTGPVLAEGDRVVVAR